MTGPRTPEEALGRSARALTAQREAARKVSQDIAAEREKEAERPVQPDGGALR